MSRPSRFPRWLLLGLAFLVVQGCDTVDPESDLATVTTELTRSGDGSPVRFSFDSDTTPTGQNVTLRCGCTVDLDPFLASRGFTRGDIVAASVQSARLVMLLPTLVRLDYLDSATLRFEASGLTSVDVASRSGFPASRDVQLSPLANRPVTRFAERDEFEPVLVIDANTLDANELYEMQVDVTLRLELQAF